MREAGFVQADPGEEANVCFINTCTVTVAADRKSRQAIKKGTVKFGKISKKGIGVLMWREIKTKE